MGLALNLQPNQPTCNALFLRLPQRLGVVCITATWRMPKGRQMLELEIERPWESEPRYELFDPYDTRVQTLVIELPVGTTAPVRCTDGMMLPADRLRMIWSPPKRGDISRGNRDASGRVSVHIDADPAIEIVRLEILDNRGIDPHDYIEYARLSTQSLRDVPDGRALRAQIAAHRAQQSVQRGRDRRIAV